MARTQLITACPLDCWDACSVVALVENGVATELRGNRAHPVTAGFLCDKTLRYPERAYSPNRIQNPMLRRPGDRRDAPDAFQPVTWDDALDICERRIREALAEGGPHSILHMQGSGSMALLKKLSIRFFNLLGGVTEPAGDICFGAGEAAMVRAFGEQTTHSPEDAVNSRFAILWGRDPFIANTHLLPFLREAKRRGAVLASINPKRLDRGALFDLQLQPVPGSDVFLALALLRDFIARGWCDQAFIGAHTDGWEPFRQYVLSRTAADWLQPTGIAAADFRVLLNFYHERRPASIWVGSGAQHSIYGMELMSALSALAAAAGNVGVAGGGISFFYKHRKFFNLSALHPRPEVRNRELPVGEFWKHLPRLDPPVRLMWVNACNPLRALPDSRAVARAVRTIPFVVAVDFHWTDTVRAADLVLPHVSFLEEEGMLSSYGHNYIALQQAVAERVGEARTDLEIFQALAERLGFGAEMRGSPREWMERFMAPLFQRDPALRERYFREGFIENPLLPRVPHQGGEFSTANGRFQFPAPLAVDAVVLPRPSDRYPLRLVTYKTKRHLLSQHAPERELAHYEVRLHPATAVRMRLAESQRVRVHSAVGEITALVAFDDAQREDVAALPLSGTVANGTAVNLLTAAVMTSDGACPAYNHTCVAIEPVA